MVFEYKNKKKLPAKKIKRIATIQNVFESYSET
jgi:hypothetical protein